MDSIGRNTLFEIIGKYIIHKRFIEEIKDAEYHSVSADEITSSNNQILSIRKHTHVNILNSHHVNIHHVNILNLHHVNKHHVNILNLHHVNIHQVNILNLHHVNKE